MRGRTLAITGSGLPLEHGGDMKARAIRWLGVSAVLLCLLAGVRLMLSIPPEVPAAAHGRLPAPPSPTVTPPPPPAPGAPPTVTVSAAALAPSPLDAEQEVLRLSLLERFGARLHEPSVQLRMLEQLIRYFRDRSPEHWLEALQDFLRKAFPGQHEALRALLRDRMDYEKWVKDNDAYLRGLDGTQRRAALRDARSRLFGKETAERLWASELKHQAMADTLQALEALQGASLAEKLSTYKQRLGEIYGSGAQAHLARHPQETMSRFLELPSVQRELTDMAPSQRTRSLRAVRQQMGLGDEALQRWDALDQTRDARWEAGARYMAERAALMQTLTGDALEARLQELRARYFGAEADIIAQEEASGLFRFTRPRQWGRN